MPASAFSELLDELVVLSGCDYMSDFHDIRSAPKLSKAVRSINAAGYPADAWNAAISYITGAERRFQTVPEAVDFLLRWLSANN